MASPYEAFARTYLRLWEPVLAPSARGLLDRCEGPRAAPVDSSPVPRVVDVGTGTGLLAIDAARRWPGAEIAGTDSADGMLEVARRRAAQELGTEQADRVRFLNAPADRLPFPDASVDLVVSSFVYQLVPDRRAALREARRVLRPGGRIGFVTWIADTSPFRPADVFDDVLTEYGIDEPEDDDDVSGNYRSASAAAAQLRRAGFRGVSAEPAWLEYAWDTPSYVACRQELWESSLLDGLEDGTRDRFLAEVRQRLDRLSSSDFRWRAPILYAFGTRPR